ncbi:MAG TPA: circadian clock protein KaiC, partial [Candidatus Binataceae bacterium]|nr:circadian clock protein KaiC [Candidatus Binataceae bacterium]
SSRPSRAAGISRQVAAPPSHQLEKALTGIEGFDEITFGGLPRGRATLLCGAAGCGKTLFASEFLVNGARKYGEPGVLMAFEETSDELIVDAASLKFDLQDLIDRKLLSIDHVVIDPHQIAETGEYDLEGLFIRLRAAIEEVGARRVVLDTIETLFSGFSNEGLLRAEIRRLFQFLKSFGVTAVVTGERGERTLTRFGLEEYVADCVVLLDQRVTEQVSTRRLRVVKYRGSTHGTNEYPFLIDEQGFSVLPITSIGLKHKVSNEVISTGVPDLDRMLGAGGIYRGCTVMLSGTAGTGKTTFSSALAKATCERGERVLFLTFEESADQIVRNMSSVGIDLRPHIESGLLRLTAQRPSLQGLEMHLVAIHKEIERFQPSVVILDPISNFVASGDLRDVTSMLTRLIDFMKTRGTTAFLTNLTTTGDILEASSASVSSIIDTWLLLRDIELSGERNRGLYVLKSRGMSHSNQIREFLLSSKGIKLIDVYLGPAGMLTGSARAAQEAAERDSAMRRGEEKNRKIAALERKRKAMEARIEALRAEFEAEETEARQALAVEEEQEQRIVEDRSEMSRSRRVNGASRG